MVSPSRPSSSSSREGGIQIRYPTRQYRYGGDRGAAFGAEGRDFSIDAGRVYRFVLGADEAPVVLTRDDVRSRLRDPLATLVLAADAALPVTARDLLTRLTTLPVQRSFVVADGGQIPWTTQTAALERQMRFVITCAMAVGELADVMISTSPAFDSAETFLQVIAWDPAATAYQFYDRRDGSWIWAGSSWDALVPPARGHGPFDSHVNGALNMKELKHPWVNWHSEAAGIRDSVLAPTDPLRAEPLWINRRQAEELERTFVRPGIIRWMNARFDACVVGGRVTRFPELLRHVLETTTVNLVTSPVANGQVGSAARIPLPVTFFIDADALLNRLGLEPDIRVPATTSAVYGSALQQFGVTIADPEGVFSVAGDTHFVFLVPERAFEDQVVLDRLLEGKVLSEKLAACLLMVDFQNPVFSPRRASLLRYAPESVEMRTGADLPSFVAAIEAAASQSPADGAEAEFLANWRLPDGEWRARFTRRIEDLFSALEPRLQAAVAFAPIFRLAESRRREFRRRKLAEFRLTTPTTNIPESAPALELTPAGDVRSKE